jgi:hypothetical protein
VIYHGDRPWQAPAAFQDLVKPLPDSLAPFVPSFGYRLVDLSGPTYAEIKGRVLTRLVQLAMRWVFDAEPVARLRELLALIDQIEERDTAVEVLESLLRYFVQGTQRVDEPTVRILLQQTSLQQTSLQQTSTGEPIMQTFIDRYIEQGINQGQRLGEATAVLRLIERKFGPPSDSVRERVLAADSDTLLEWLDRILVAESVEAVLH